MATSILPFLCQSECRLFIFYFFSLHYIKNNQSLSKPFTEPYTCRHVLHLNHEPWLNPSSTVVNMLVATDEPLGIFISKPKLVLVVGVWFWACHLEKPIPASHPIFSIFWCLSGRLFICAIDFAETERCSLVVGNCGCLEKLTEKHKWGSQIFLVQQRVCFQCWL